MTTTKNSNGEELSDDSVLLLMAQGRACLADIYGVLHRLLQLLTDAPNQCEPPRYELPRNLNGRFRDDLPDGDAPSNLSGNAEVASAVYPHDFVASVIVLNGTMSVLSHSSSSFAASCTINSRGLIYSEQKKDLFLKYRPTFGRIEATKSNTN